MDTRKRPVLASFLTTFLCLAATVGWWGMEHLPLEAEAAQEMTLTASKTALDEYVFEGLDGAPIALNAYAGKAVVLNFWATWCPPCIKELPDLDALAAKYKDKNLVVVAASQDKDLNKLKEYVKAHPMPNLIIVQDTQKLFYKQKLEGLPTTILFNVKGEEVERIPAFKRWLEPDALALIDTLL